VLRCGPSVTSSDENLGPASGSNISEPDLLTIILSNGDPFKRRAVKIDDKLDKEPSTEKFEGKHWNRLETGTGPA